MMWSHMRAFVALALAAAAAISAGQPGPSVFPTVESFAARADSLFTGDVAAEYSADGKRIMTASSEGTVSIWDASTGAEICTVATFGDGNWVVASADGRFDSNSASQGMRRSPGLFHEIVFGTR